MKSDLEEMFTPTRALAMEIKSAALYMNAQKLGKNAVSRSVK